MPNPLTDKIREVVTPPTEGAGYELVDVEWKREQSGWVCRVFIDRPDRGISHEDCERVSRELSAVLDVHDVIPQAYSLEVSSPGLDRPLRTVAHFSRFVGKKARVRMRQGVEGRRNFSGTIVGVSGGHALVEVEGQEFALPVADIERANLVFELNKKTEGR